MAPPRIKTLETCALAAGAAFGVCDDEFELRPRERGNPGRIAAMGLAISGGVVAVAHYFGLVTTLAQVTGWKSAA